MKKLVEIYDPRLKILRAIPVQESRDDDGQITLWNSAILHFGAGDSFVEAADDFIVSLCELYWILKDKQLILGPAMWKQWKFLRAYVGER